MKIVLIAFLMLILAALAGAGFFMLRRKPHPGEPDKRMARALTWRVALSLGLFALILLAYALGWIQPQGFALHPSR